MPSHAVMKRTGLAKDGFHLNLKDSKYYASYGTPFIRQHAKKIIRDRLSAASPNRDGKQTPYRNHPVFVAQHFTKTCCRTCIQKKHKIKKGKKLSRTEQSRLVAIIMRWLVSRQGYSRGKQQMITTYLKSTNTTIKDIY